MNISRTHLDKVIIILGGGPGLSPDYLSPFHQHLSLTDYGIVTYAPLLSLTERSKIGLSNGVDELIEIVESFDQKEVTLLGHSFGGMIVLEYLMTHKVHASIKKIILNNPVADIKKYNSNLRVLMNNLPEKSKSRLFELEAERHFGEEFWGIFMTDFSARHACIVSPVPEDLQESLSKVDISLYQYFFGENPFDIGGRLADWKFTKPKEAFDKPILLVGGNSDTVFEEDIHHLQKKLKNASTFMTPQSAHYPFWENPEAYFPQIKAFLDAD
ncbi:MAG: proline iminopeptidase [Cyclobacteriaceae bacterium]|jgi:proline iminopeptidase